MWLLKVFLRCLTFFQFYEFFQFFSSFLICFFIFSIFFYFSISQKLNSYLTIISLIYFFSNRNYMQASKAQVGASMQCIYCTTQVCLYLYYMCYLFCCNKIDTYDLALDSNKAGLIFMLLNIQKKFSFKGALWFEKIFCSRG